jgi:hypothetical protein
MAKQCAQLTRVQRLKYQKRMKNYHVLLELFLLKMSVSFQAKSEIRKMVVCQRDGIYKWRIICWRANIYFRFDKNKIRNGHA